MFDISSNPQNEPTHSAGEGVGKRAFSYPDVCLGLRGFPGSRISVLKKAKFWAKQDELVLLKYGLYSTTVLESQ